MISIVNLFLFYLLAFEDGLFFWMFPWKSHMAIETNNNYTLIIKRVWLKEEQIMDEMDANG